MFENAFLMYRATYSIVLNNRLVVLIVLHGIYQCKSSLPKLPGFQTATAEKTEKIAGLLLRPEEYIKWDFYLCIWAVTGLFKVLGLSGVK